MHAHVRASLLWALGMVTGCAAAPSSPRLASTPTAPSAPTAATATDAPVIAATVSLFDHERGLLVTDEDNGTLVVMDTATRTVRARHVLHGRPVAAAVLDDGRVFVVDREGDCLRTLRLDERGTTLREGPRVAVAPDPVGLAVSPDHHTLFVASGASAKLTVLDADTLRARRVLATAREPRAMAFSPDGARLYVSHTVGAALSVVDLEHLGVRQIPLPAPRQRALFDARRPRMAADRSEPVERNARALSRALAVSRDRRRLFVPHVVEATIQSTEPGVESEGYGSSQHASLSPPVVPSVAVLDMVTETWRPAQEDLRGGAIPAPFADPTAVAVRPTDGKLMVVGRGTRTLSELEPSAPDPALSGRTMALSYCDGPNGLAVAQDGTAWVFCQFDHEVQAVSMRAADATGRVSVGADPLAADVSVGRRLFHRADMAEISRVGFSCETCHPDGRDDGNVWSSPDGVRQTPFLAGRLEGTAPYNWLGASATLESNMQQTMRRLQGTGLDRTMLASLRAYLVGGLRAPSSALQNVDSHTIERGQRVFAQAGCPTCHNPDQGFVDGHTHDVGLRNATDRSVAFDTPSLRFVGLTAPYGHDGRYSTLGQMLTARDHRMSPGVELAGDDLAALTDYLQTL